MEKPEEQFSFKGLFVPLTTLKSIHWIIIAGLVVFSNMLFNGFVWDDITFIVNNPAVHSLNIPSLIGHNAINTGGFYRPLAAIYSALIYTIFGENAFFYHFFSLVIHLINVSLVFILFKHFFSKRLSLFLSLIFLIHPIQVETVSYISGAGDLLFFIFGISALVLSLKDNLSRKRLGLISLLLLLSILLKETGFLFLLTVIFYKIIFKHKNIIPILISGSVISLLYIAVRLGIGNADTAGHSGYAQIYSLPLIARAINIPEIINYYLRITVYPVNLAIGQQWIVNSISFSTFYFPLLIDLIFFGVIFLIGFLIRKNKKNFSTFLFFALMFLMGLSLHLQIIPLDMTVSDRWFYFPFVGLLGMVGLVCALIKSINKKVRIFFYTVGLLVIVALSTRTIVRNTNWTNNITLYAHDAKIYDNYQIEGNLGSEYLSQGNDEKFLYHTNRSIKLFPNELSISNLAYFYLVHGDMEKARQYYKKALSYNIYPPEGHKIIVDEIYRGIAWSYIHSEQFEQARAFIKTVLPEYPAEDILWGDLAISEYKLGNKKEALVAAEKAKNLLQNAATNYIYNQILNNKPIKWN
jgi:protein O-mannosyl-transferase